jgi:pectinesterase
MKNVYLVTIILTIATSLASAQNKQQVDSGEYLKMNWEHVATKMPDAWYGSDDAKLVAENVLLAQKEIGGWEKNKPYHLVFSASEKEHYTNDKSKIGATFDNGATITELRFLAKVYAHVHDARYKQAFEKGLSYIFISQYENGGWPQFFPVRQGRVSYSEHITYNDDAMVNTMNFLKEIYTNDKEFDALQLSSKKKEEAKRAFGNGVKCILNTQIIADGKRTVWCAQHDEKTLKPANARSYELASYSGAESVGITLLLMNIDHPSKDIIDAVNGAVQWFESHKIEGIRIDREIDQDGKKNKVVVADKDAEPLWGRFYDLKTDKPYFCSRDGIKKNSLAEISDNRRNGYRWYTNGPEEVLRKYPAWKKTVTTI